MSLQAVMAVNTKKRLSGLCKTYRAEPKDNVGVFVELKYIKCINNILIRSCSCFEISGLFILAGRLPGQLIILETIIKNGTVLSPWGLGHIDMHINAWCCRW